MRVRAVVLRIIKHFVYDVRTLALLLIAPLLLMTLLSLVLTVEPHIPTIALYSVPEVITEAFENSEAEVQIFASKDDALEAVRINKADALLDMSISPPLIVLEGSSPTVSGATLRFIGSIFEKLRGEQNTFEPSVHYIHGYKDMSLFDYGGPILIAFLGFFFVFLTAGVSFLRERTSGTLERLLGTPIKAWELVSGYILGFGIFVTIQVVIMSVFAVEILGVMLVGSIIDLIIITVIVALTALVLGMLLSNFAHNEFQIVQFIPVIIIPQLLFSGLFNEEGFPLPLRLLGTIMPVGYGSRALGEIMIRGRNLYEVMPDAAALLGFLAVLSLLNVWALKRTR